MACRCVGLCGDLQERIGDVSSTVNVCCRCRGSVVAGWRVADRNSMLFGRFHNRSDVIVGVSSIVVFTVVFVFL